MSVRSLWFWFVDREWERLYGGPIDEEWKDEGLKALAHEKETLSRLRTAREMLPTPVERKAVSRTCAPLSDQDLGYIRASADAARIFSPPTEWGWGPMTDEWRDVVYALLDELTAERSEASTAP